MFLNVGLHLNLCVRLTAIQMTPHIQEGQRSDDNMRRVANGARITVCHPVNECQSVAGVFCWQICVPAGVYFRQICVPACCRSGLRAHRHALWSLTDKQESNGEGPAPRIPLCCCLAIQRSAHLCICGQVPAQIHARSAGTSVSFSADIRGACSGDSQRATVSGLSIRSAPPRCEPCVAPPSLRHV